jgi:hypothetical protein
VTRVSVPFTEGHYYGWEERPNTELAANSLPASRIKKMINSIVVIGKMADRNNGANAPPISQPNGPIRMKIVIILSLSTI